MKKTILLFATFFLLAATAGAQGMKAFISHKAYCTNTMQPYIEFTFIIGGRTVNYAPAADGRFRADVEIQVDMMRDDTLVKQLHYILNSDSFEDTARLSKPDFADIQNVPMPQGDFFLYFYLIDLHGNGDTLSYIDKIAINFPEDAVSTSKLSLFRSLTAADGKGLFEKYGYELPPLYSNFVPESQYTLPFALEVYNTRRLLGSQKIKADCYIQSAESRLVVNPNNVLSLQAPTDDVVLFINEFNVFNLPSGNYFAVVDLFDSRDSMIQSEKVFFQKSNPSVKLNLEEYSVSSVKGTFVEADTNHKELVENVKSLFPISTHIERDFYENNLKKVSTEQLQSYFYSFWKKRNPSNPEEAWKKYKARVDYVQDRFGSRQVKGYLTDRGRIYLQYGQPNEINEVPSDPVTLPYEIWHYYYLEGQSNVKFIFYDPVLTGRDYELLHSNLYGELNNPNWKMNLVRKIQSQQDIYETNPVDYWGNDMDEYFRFH